MYKILFSRKLTKHDHVRIFRSLFVFTNCTALSLYAFLRILFYSTPISTADDVTALVKTLLIGSLAALILYTVLAVVELADYIIAKKKLSFYPALKYAGVAFFAMLVVYLAGCSMHI
jgi:hypothetical protein